MSSGAVDPLLNPQAWDVVKVGGRASPGLCKVSEAKRAFEFDVKKGKGTLGATITFVGRPPAKFSVTFRLWTSLHFQQWDVFRPFLKYDPTKQTVQAVRMYHPSLADIDIHDVVTESIGNIIHEGDQLYTITCEFLEYFPPPKTSAVSTPTGSRANAGGSTTGTGSPADPIADAQQKEIAALLKQASAP